MIWFFWQPLTEPTYAFFRLALASGLVVGVSCALVGTFMVLRRQSFLGDALSHAMLAGVVVGYLVMDAMLGDGAHAGALVVGALTAAMLTTLLVSVVSRISRLKEDTAIGILYTVMFAAGGVLATVFRDRVHVDLLHFIMGNVLTTTTDALWLSSLVLAALITGVLVLYRPLQLCTFDPVMAAAGGFPVRSINLGVMLATALVVVSGVQLVGVILVVGLLITPASAALLITQRLWTALLAACVVAAVSVIGGLYLSLATNTSGGAPIILVATTCFVFALVWSRLRDRWLRPRVASPTLSDEKRAAL